MKAHNRQQKRKFSTKWRAKGKLKINFGFCRPTSAQWTTDPPCAGRMKKGSFSALKESSLIVCIWILYTQSNKHSVVDLVKKNKKQNHFNRTWMWSFVKGMFSGILTRLGFMQKEATLVLIGLDNSGKTTLQYRLKTGSVQEFMPTQRAKDETMVFVNTCLSNILFIYIYLHIYQDIHVYLCTTR